MKKNFIIKLAVFAFANALLFIFTESLMPQDSFKEWKNKESDNRREFDSTYVQNFNNYISEQDLNFAEYLMQEWKSFDAFKGIVRDSIPKPIKSPVWHPAKSKSEDDESKEDHQINTIFDERKPSPKLPSQELFNLPEYKIKSLDKIAELKTLPYCVDFYGNTLDYNVPASFILNEGYSPSPEFFANAWLYFSSSPYDLILTQSQLHANRLVLNDWGYILLLKKLSEEICPDSKVNSLVTQWFLLIKSGYDARLGYNENNLCILITTRQIIYETVFFLVDEKRYFVVFIQYNDGSTSKFFIYDHEYASENKQADLRIIKEPNLFTYPESRTLRFKKLFEEDTCKINFNKSLIEFYQEYPQTDLEIVFNGSLSNEAKHSIERELKPLLDPNDEIAAVNTLLKFVQTAFEYQTDLEQFGEENYLFAEETLFYEHSDCEDRSVLFADLVSKLIGLEVIGLEFPGHVAAAVCFSKEVKGYEIDYNNKKYLICDPTYINATAGQCMPEFRDKTAKIIDISRF